MTSNCSENLPLIWSSTRSGLMPRSGPSITRLLIASRPSGFQVRMGRLFSPSRGQGLGDEQAQQRCHEPSSTGQTNPLPHRQSQSAAQVRLLGDHAVTAVGFHTVTQREPLEVRDDPPSRHR